jgi:beta-lactamase superfamily II metal-dependent hydrolase
MKTSILRAAVFAALSVFVAAFAAAQVKITVVDVGTGECLVMRPATGGCMVYDTGDPTERAAVMEGLERTVPDSGVIDLLVLSHNDTDHIGNVPQVLEKYTVKEIVWVGDDRLESEKKPHTRPTVWEKADSAISGEGAEVIDLSKAGPVDSLPNRTLTVGDAKAALVTGEGHPRAEWKLSTKPEKRNAVSIVVRVEYAGRSVLVCGDALGRKANSDTSDENCIAAEMHMLKLEKDGKAVLASDVMVAGHHGADNSSSNLFIRAVHPGCVIFAAGHDEGYQHPRSSTVLRFEAEGVPTPRQLRTDFGDFDGPMTWDQWRDPAGDESGDDDIEVLIAKDGELTCQYVDPANRAKARELAARSLAALVVERKFVVNPPAD